MFKGQAKEAEPAKETGLGRLDECQKSWAPASREDLSRRQGSNTVERSR